MKKLKRIAEEITKRARNDIAGRGSLICSDCYSNGAEEGIREGIKLCKEACIKDGFRAILDIEKILEAEA
jgi:hypothetical protein